MARFAHRFSFTFTEQLVTALFHDHVFPLGWLYFHGIVHHYITAWPCLTFIMASLSLYNMLLHSCMATFAHQSGSTLTVQYITALLYDHVCSSGQLYFHCTVQHCIIAWPRLPIRLVLLSFTLHLH